MTFISRGWIQSLASLVGIDEVFLTAVAGRAIPMAGGLLTTFLVGTHVPAVIQGYFYTFVSLLGLQLLVELGLGQVMVQFAAHEWAFLRLDEGLHVFGDVQALSRLNSLSRLAVAWFGCAALVLMLVLGGAGLFIFGETSDAAWKGPWFLLCALTAANLGLLPVQFLLEGCNQLPAVYRLRALQSFCNYGGLCVAIMAGAGLWANAIGAGASLGCTLTFLAGRHRRFYAALLRRPAKEKINWATELLPMQWRIALSAGSGYLAFSILTPLSFRLVGPIDAGQMGMSLALINALGGVSVLPVLIKAPSFGMAIARKDYAALDRAAMKAWIICIVLLLAGGVTLTGGLYFLRTLAVPFSHRVLPMTSFVVLLFANILNYATAPIGYYLRAHKREPLVWVSVTLGLGIAGLSFALGRRWGTAGMAMAYMVVILMMTPVTSVIWMRCRRAWHATY